VKSVRKGILSILFALTALVPPAFAAQYAGTVSAEPTVSSVFFATDREQRPDPKGLNFGAQLNEPMDHVAYGVVGNRTAEPDNQKLYSSFDSMSKELHDAVNRSERKELVIFVHGCCVSFKEAVKQSTQLVHQVDTPVLLYDWGSPTASYQGSILACPRSQERFNKFMMQVSHEFPNEKIALVGLSMGGIFIDNFFLQFRPNEVGRSFDQVVFARADMDSIAFKTHIPRISQHAKHLFVYAGKNDLAMNVSQLLRLVSSPVVHGERVGRLAAHLTKQKALQVIDVSPLKLNHKLPCAVVADLLSCEGGKPADGQYDYIEMSDGLWRVQPRN
jgi:esterase/lipase superfamily enzyme